MANRNRIAMTIAGDKAQHPERYCRARRCLWKTSTIGPDGKYILNAEPCRKHPELNTAPSITEKTRALAEDTFGRIAKSVAAQDAHARKFA